MRSTRKEVEAVELIDRLREALEKELGIKTDAELIKEVNESQGVDLGIFVTPLKVGVENAV